MRTIILFVIALTIFRYYSQQSSDNVTGASGPKIVGSHQNKQEVLEQIAQIQISDPIRSILNDTATTAAPEPAVATPLTSEDQLTTMFEQPGFKTYRAFDGSHYFKLRGMNQGRRSGLSSEMRVFYDVSDGTVTLAGEIRPLKPGEPAGIADEWNADRVPLLHATFVVIPAPPDAGGLPSMQDTIMVVKLFDPHSFTVETARGVRDLFVLALTPGSGIWP